MILYNSKIVYTIVKIQHTITLNNGSGNSEFICQQYFELSGLKTNVQYSNSKWVYEESEIA